MFHEFIKPAHMVSGQMRRLGGFVAPALRNPDQAGGTRVFGKAILQAAVQCLNMRGVKHDAFSISREALRLDLHESLNNNHVSDLAVVGYREVKVSLASVPDLLVMPDHLIYDETQEFLGEIRVQLRIAGELAEAVDLPFFACRVGRGERRFCLILAYRLRDLEPFGKHEHQSSVDIVDAVAVSGKNIIVAHLLPSAAIARIQQAEMRRLHLPWPARLGTAGGL
jgi:hypothetical protein